MTGYTLDNFCCSKTKMHLALVVHVILVINDDDDDDDVEQMTNKILH